MINWGNFISQCFNGLVLGALLALMCGCASLSPATLVPSRTARHEREARLLALLEDIASLPAGFAPAAKAALQMINEGVIPTAVQCVNDMVAVGAVETLVQQGHRVPEDISVVGFGTFSVKHRAARSGRNPRTGDTIEIAASNVPGFKAGKALKDAVN